MKKIIISNIFVLLVASSLHAFDLHELSEAVKRNDIDTVKTMVENKPVEMHHIAQHEKDHLLDTAQICLNNKKEQANSLFNLPRFKHALLGTLSLGLSSFIFSGKVQLALIKQVIDVDIRKTHQSIDDRVDFCTLIGLQKGVSQGILATIPFVLGVHWLYKAITNAESKENYTKALAINQLLTQAIHNK